MDLLSDILKIAATFILTFLFGLERQRAHKPVGFGTFTFVAIGACGLAITSINIDPDNPFPLIAAIVTSIGFLGVGALIRTGDKIFGFTTAASIWLFAIFGIFMGVGEYAIAILIYAMIWGVIYFDSYLENHGIGSYQKKLILTTNKIVPQKEIEQILLLITKKKKLISTELDKKNSKAVFIYQIEGKRDEINAGLKKFYEKDWFDSFKVE